jgi:hypothetical protein
MTASPNMDPISWLEESQPGFDQIGKDERDAIRDFSLLWSLYEERSSTRQETPVRSSTT